MSSCARDVAAARRPPGVRWWLRHVTTGTTAVGVMLLGAPLAGGHAGSHDAREPTTEVSALSLAAAHPRQHRWRGHPGRYIRPYTVRRGDTATGLAVRFHAWTAELVALNHLSRHATLYVGERLRIPVVAAAARRARHHRAHRQRAHQPPRHHTRRSHHPGRHRTPAARPRHRPLWRHADASRVTVRRVVSRAARRHGVPRHLALAIAWQESGWQQRRVSPAGAIGVMQVMPGTGRWMSLYAGHRLHLRRLHQNVTAGVTLIRVLRSEAPGRRAIAGYYQGLTSVRRHGMYPSTRRYVANVVAIRHRLRHGWDPT